MITIVAVAASVGTAAAATPTGEWLVDGGYARVRIENCDNVLWGVVAWERTAGRDRNNSDASKRDRPTLGLPILLGMKQMQPNRWDGKIYNTEDGRTYTAHISLRSDDVLRVEGCVLGFLCGGQDWARVAAKPILLQGRRSEEGRSQPVGSQSEPGQPNGEKSLSAAELCSMITESAPPGSSSDRASGRRKSPGR